MPIGLLRTVAIYKCGNGLKQALYAIVKAVQVQRDTIEIRSLEVS